MSLQLTKVIDKCSFSKRQIENHMENQFSRGMQPPISSISGQLSYLLMDLSFFKCCGE